DSSYRRFDYDTGKLLAVGNAAGYETTLTYGANNNCPCGDCNAPNVPAGALCSVQADVRFGNSTYSTLGFRGDHVGSPQNPQVWHIGVGPDYNGSQQYVFEFHYTSSGDLDSLQNGDKGDANHTPIAWTFTYTPEGRIATFTDRDSHTWTITGATN